MGHYKLRDAFNGPSLLSLARVPLAVLFPFVASSPWQAAVVLCASGLTDVLDGYWARRFNKATATGAAIDPVTDKIFVGAVVVTLILQGNLPWWAVIALSTREIGELPLVVYFVLSRHARQRRADYPKANVPGKLATIMQFAAVLASLWRWNYQPVLLLLAALTGLLAAIVYWQRELTLARADSA